MIYKTINFDFIFLSYDEPNAELLYSELVNLVPWAKRVHGVKGFDTAHRRCAEISDTDFFITVDGDNSVYPEFLDQEIDIADDQHDHAWTWAGRNYVNGLIYGNGGLKLWSKEYVMNMNSHENSDDPTKSVEFCWSNKYHEVLGCYSSTMVNGSPMQAWRSGFREGVKMCLNRGKRVEPKNFTKDLWPGNIERLCVWASLGQDVDNGIWSIYGARLGCYMTMFTDWDHSRISDYEAMNLMWNDVQSKDPYKESIDLGKSLKQSLGLDIADIDADTSKFVKRIFINTPRQCMSPQLISHFTALRNV
jgi:hypothetical protein